MIEKVSHQQRVNRTILSEYVGKEMVLDVVVVNPISKFECDLPLRILVVCRQDCDFMSLKEAGYPSCSNCNWNLRFPCRALAGAKNQPRGLSSLVKLG